MNFSADPCDDFFAFACDNYIAKHPLGNRKQFNVIGELRTELSSKSKVTSVFVKYGWNLWQALIL